MFRLSDPQPADVIIDPMCGTGAIPIEVPFSPCFLVLKHIESFSFLSRYVYLLATSVSGLEVEITTPY